MAKRLGQHALRRRSRPFQFSLRKLLLWTFLLSVSFAGIFRVPNPYATPLLLFFWGLSILLLLASIVRANRGAYERTVAVGVLLPALAVLLYCIGYHSELVDDSSFQRLPDEYKSWDVAVVYRQGMLIAIVSGVVGGAVGLAFHWARRQSDKALLLTRRESRRRFREAVKKGEIRVP